MKIRAVAMLAALSVLSVPLPALAKPVEIELHIEATAQVPPDRAVVTVTVTGIGANDSEARRNLAASEAEMRSDFASMGIFSSKVKPAAVDKDGAALVAYGEEEAAGAGCAAAAARADAAAAAGDAASPKAAKPRKINPADYGCPEPPITVNTTMLVEVSDQSLLPKLAENGTEARTGYTFGRRPVFMQTDPAAARKTARDQAIAKARDEAAAYAESLGYKVVRITRVSNARPSINLQDVVTFLVGLDDRSNRMQPSWFATTIVESVAIDFVIVPK